MLLPPLLLTPYHESSAGLHRYWMEPLMGLTKPETRKVAMQLTSDNKLGYRSQKGGPVSKGSLLQYVIEQKDKHPTKVSYGEEVDTLNYEANVYLVGAANKCR